MAGSAAPVAPINVTGTGSEDVPISIAAGTPYLATIINTGQGPFTVWTLGADGAQNEQLVNVTGPFAGTRLFDEEGHSTGFSVASDGSWSIEVNPVSAARSWDLSERLAGDGADVVAVLPPTSADTDTTVRYDGGALVISAHTSAGAVELLRDTGPLEEELVLPSGTSLIEVEADAAWSIAPQ